MMNKLREYTKTILWVVIVAFIGTIIFAWGKGGFRGNDKYRDLVGEVEGYQIRSREFMMLYDQLYRQVLDEKGEVSEAEEERIRETTWAQIMNEILVQSWIEALGLTVTNQELVEAIRNYPPQEWIANPPEWLATEGEFDYDKYLQLLASNDPMVVQQLFVPLEQRYRRQLIVDKVQRIVASSSRLTGPELLRHFTDREEKVKVRYIEIQTEEFDGKAGEITDDDVRDYYITYRDTKFTHGKGANLKYVRFPVEPTAAEIDSVRAELEQIRVLIQKEEDFAELATAYSQDGSALRGGDIGWLRRGPGSGEVEEVAFSLQVGGISEPFRTKQGWQILKVTDRKREKNQQGEWETQVRASSILLRVEISDATRQRIYRQAQDFLGRADQKNFELLAEEFGLELKETGVFIPGAMVPQIGDNEEINDFAFANKPGTVSPIFHTRAALYVCMVSERIKPGYIPFEEVKDRVREILRYRRQAQLATDKARQLLAEINAGGNFTRVAKSHGYEAKETPYFSRVERLPGVGRPPEFFAVAFSLSREEPVQLAASEHRSCLLELVDHIPADMERFASAKDSLRSELAKKAQETTLNHWFVYIIDHGDINDYRSRFFGP